jgi:hypothetical protein
MILCVRRVKEIAKAQGCSFVCSQRSLCRPFNPSQHMQLGHACCASSLPLPLFHEAPKTRASPQIPVLDERHTASSTSIWPSIVIQTVSAYLALH